MAQTRVGGALTLKEMDILVSQEIDDDTYPETMAKLGCSRMTIARTKQKPAYCELLQKILEDKQMGLEYWADRLEEASKAKKEINVDGGVVEVVDNVARTQARQDAFRIFGAYAPDEHKVTHGLASASDAELDQDLEAACQEFGVDEPEGEPGYDGGDAEPLEGTVL